MTRTERAELILGIAKRVLQEAKDGRSVDPDRLAWARAVGLNAREELQGPTKSSQLHGLDIDAVHRSRARLQDALGQDA